jgi:hypothetical protein
MQANRAANGTNDSRVTEARERAEQHQRNAMRLDVGLPVELTQEEKPAAVLAIFEAELARLGEDADDVAFTTACDRAERRCEAL